MIYSTRLATVARRGLVATTSAAAPRHAAPRLNAASRPFSSSFALSKDKHPNDSHAPTGSEAGVRADQTSHDPLPDHKKASKGKKDDKHSGHPLNDAPSKSEEAVHADKGHHDPLKK